MARKDTGENRTDLHLTPVKDIALRDAIIDAISSYELSESDAWGELDALSSHTEVEAIEANTEGIFVIGDSKFEATATVYLILNYGDKKDAFSTTDSFPAHITGSIAHGPKIEIESFSVDTSSFFGDDQEDEADGSPF